MSRWDDLCKIARFYCPGMEPIFGLRRVSSKDSWEDELQFELFGGINRRVFIFYRQFPKEGWWGRCWLQSTSRLLKNAVSLIPRREAMFFMSIPSMCMKMCVDVEKVCDAVWEDVEKWCAEKNGELGFTSWGMSVAVRRDELFMEEDRLSVVPQSVDVRRHSCTSLSEALVQADLEDVMGVDV